VGDLRFRQSHLLHELKDTAKTKGYRVTEMSPQAFEISRNNTMMSHRLRQFIAQGSANTQSGDSS